MTYGGAWTSTKLAKVEAYLIAFQRVLQHTTFKRVYVEGFSGGGDVELAHVGDAPLLQEGRVFLKGSAQRALALKQPFDRYVFIDADPDAHQSLRARVTQEHPHLAGRIEYHTGDANRLLPEVTGNLDPRRDRAVVFADPFAMQMDWSTIAAVSRATVDFWYLAPTSALVRMLKREGELPQGWSERLDRFLGEQEWRDRWYRPSDHGDLFGAPATLQRIANLDQIEADLWGRLNTVFRMAERRLRLPSKGSPLFTLMFGCSNRNERAFAAACKIANHLLKG